MKKDLLELLSLSAGERKGIVVLIVIIIILSAIQLYTAFRKTPPASFNDSTFFSTLVPGENKEDTTVDFANYQLEEFVDNFELFEFDPNKIDAGDLLRLGINERVVRTWLNFRRKGGTFDKPADISKVYGLSSEMAGRLIPYVRIDHRGESETRNVNFKVKIPDKKNLNEGDSIDFLDIKGIGPVLSGRIIKYRKLLGGYCRMDQLKEVYGFDSSIIPEVAERFYADTLLIIKMSINDATEEHMRRHPYIGRHIAGGIAAYRKQAGRVKSMRELVTNGILTSEEFEKLKPYLCL